MKKLPCKSVRKVEEDPTKKPKMKFNTRYHLRQKARHTSINTEKDERRDNRINTELVNSQTFHDNTMTDE